MLQIWSTQIVTLQSAKTQSEATILHCCTLYYVLKRAAVSYCAWCQPWLGERLPLNHGRVLPIVLFFVVSNLSQHVTQKNFLYYFLDGIRNFLNFA